MGKTKDELLEEAYELGIDEVDEDSTNAEIQDRINEAKAEQGESDVDETEETEEDPGPAGGPVGQGEEAAPEDREANELAEDEETQEEYLRTKTVGSGGDVNLTPDDPKIGEEQEDPKGSEVPKARD